VRTQRGLLILAADLREAAGGHAHGRPTLLGDVHGGGAELVALPEYFCLLGRSDTDKLAVAVRPGGAGDVTESRVELVVSDTGIGIAPAFLPHVFERFRQGNARATRTHGGLGLGLAIVRHLTEMHGGSVAAVSAGEGKGATFIVRLPTA